MPKSIITTIPSVSLCSRCSQLLSSSPWLFVSRRLACLPACLPLAVLLYYSTPKSAHTSNITATALPLPRPQKPPCPVRSSQIATPFSHVLSTWQHAAAPPPSRSKVWKRASLHVLYLHTLSPHKCTACMQPDMPHWPQKSGNNIHTTKSKHASLPTGLCFPWPKEPHAARMHAEQNTRSFTCSKSYLTKGPDHRRHALRSWPAVECGP